MAKDVQIRRKWHRSDLLRLWASSVNFEADVAISESIIKTIADQYRKIRNTFKFMLGNLQDGADKPYIPGEKPALWPVDNWVLAQFEEVKNGVLAAYESFSFSKVQMLLTNFMVELSSFYLDMTKDIMYCEKASSPRRKAVQYVLYKLTKELCLLFNPILSFTMDEVYSYLPGEKKASPQLEDMPSETHEYGEEDKVMYAKFKDYRALVLKALENKRNEGLIGSSLEAELALKVADAGLYEVLSKLEKDDPNSRRMSLPVISGSAKPRSRKPRRTPSSSLRTSTRFANAAELLKLMSKKEEMAIIFAIDAPKPSNNGRRD